MTDTVDAVVAVPTAAYEPLSGKRRVLHFMTLSAFAFAQPLLSLIPERTLFLHDLQPRWSETVLFTVGIIVVLPLFFAGLDVVWRKLARRFLPKLVDGVLYLLLLHVLLSFFKPLIDVPVLQKQGISWLVLLLTSSGLAFGWLRWLKRSPGAERWLMACSIGVLLFPGWFLWKMAPAVAPNEEVAAREAVPIKRPVPIVMIVFDEFCGLALQNENREIDAGRFPNFARLAKTANWYRNATTNCGETIDALPALLSGLLPSTTRKPIARDYPQNLFQMIQDSQQYEMVVFEPVSRLCDEGINDYRRNPGTVFEQLGTLSLTALCVYPHLVTAKDSLLPMPAIPKPWFGLSHPLSSSRERRQGLIQYYWDGDRDMQINHFADCIVKREQTEFFFMHVVLPHYPWQFLPSGNYYYSHPADIPLGSQDEIWMQNDLLCAQAYQKFLLQVGYMDRWLGTLLDHLENEGLMDECMLVVTADHGVSFMPGHSRRKPDGENLAEILSIPLFIKFPGQSESKIEDRNVESIDVFPTIAAVLEQPLAQPVDGSSLQDQDAPPRPRKTITFDHKETIAEAKFPQGLKALRRFQRLSGTSTAKDRLFKLGPRVEWIGRPLSDFTIIEGKRIADIRDPRKSRLIEQGQLVNLLIDGQVRDFDEASKPVTLVAATDGVIRGTTHTYSGINRPGRFELFMPEDVAIKCDGNYEVFAVVPGKKMTLERLTQNHKYELDMEFRAITPTNVAPQKSGTPKTLKKP